jgi:hypothetical protein
VARFENVDPEDDVSELRITTRNIQNMLVEDVNVNADGDGDIGQISSGLMENRCLSSSQRLLNSLAEMSELLMSEKMVCCFRVCLTVCICICMLMRACMYVCMNT